MKKILVTGATGYIGSHLIKALAYNRSDYSVYATDFNLEQNDISKFLKTPVLKYDIRESEIQDFEFIKFDTVIHLAAKTSVSRSMIDPALYMRTNILGTENVIKNFCTEKTHFVYCSTGAAENPQSCPYALSKHGGEMIARTLPNYSICRLYNVSGNAGLFKFDNDYSHLIRKLAATVVGHFSQIQIHGNNYDTPDGTTIRHYTHVSDIVNALVRVIDNGPTNKIHYFGSQYPLSILQVIEAMEKVSGFEIPKTIGPAREGDIPISSYPRADTDGFFKETFTIEQQCLSAINAESYYLRNFFKKPH